MKRKTLSHRAASCLFRNVDSTPSASVLFKFRSTLFKFVQDKKNTPLRKSRSPKCRLRRGPALFVHVLFTFVHDKKNSQEFSYTRFSPSTRHAYYDKSIPFPPISAR